MTIYEYILEDAGAGFTCPPWIDNGGYWQKGDKLIGIRNDNNVSSIPNGAVSFTADELEARQLALHAENPFRKEVNQDDNQLLNYQLVNMTNAEVSAMVQGWITNQT